MKKLLIANRGEIALRVIRTAREMGIATVAIYTDQDRNAPYVDRADEAFHLPGDTYNETYLNMDRIVDICERSGADAIHPGYGFCRKTLLLLRKYWTQTLCGGTLVQKFLTIWETKLLLAVLLNVRR